VDGLVGLFDVIVLAEGLPSFENDLDQNFAQRNVGRARHAVLIRLQIELYLMSLSIL